MEDHQIDIKKLLSTDEQPYRMSLTEIVFNIMVFMLFIAALTMLYQKRAEAQQGVRVASITEISGMSAAQCVDERIAAEDRKSRALDVISGGANCRHERDRCIAAQNELRAAERHMELIGRHCNRGATTGKDSSR